MESIAAAPGCEMVFFESEEKSSGTSTPLPTKPPTERLTTAVLGSTQRTGVWGSWTTLEGVNCQRLVMTAPLWPGAARGWRGNGDDCPGSDSMRRITAGPRRLPSLGSCYY